MSLVQGLERGHALLFPSFQSMKCLLVVIPGLPLALVGLVKCLGSFIALWRRGWKIGEEKLSLA